MGVYRGVSQIHVSLNVIPLIRFVTFCLILSTFVTFLYTCHSFLAISQMADARACYGCKEDKPLCEFRGTNKEYRAGYRYYCRDCRVLRTQRNYAKLIVSSAKSYDKRHGIIPEDHPYINRIWVDEMIQQQSEKCACCRTPMTFGEGCDRRMGTGLSIIRRNAKRAFTQDNTVFACTTCKRGKFGIIPTDTLDHTVNIM